MIITMDTSELQQIAEALQNFSLLKKQQLLIHSWISLKIFVKRKLRLQSIRSQNSSLTLPKAPKGFQQTQFNPILIDEYDQYVQPPFAQKPNSINSSAHNRFGTDRTTPKSQRQNQKKVREYPGSKSRHYTEMQKSVDGQYIPFIVQEQYLVNCQDNDQFEDMILDRLSKLEESISQIIEERKLHEENSGNIDYSNYENPLFQNVPQLNFKDHSSEEESFPDINPPYPVQNVNAKFSYNLESSSLVRDSIQENSYQHEADLSDWKYIPIGKEKEPVDNIKKIKNILQKNHVNNEDYLFINDVDDFNENQVADYQRHSRKKSHYRPQQYTERIYANGGYAFNLDEYQEDESDYNMKQKSASFRLNRVQMNQENDRIQINQYTEHNYQQAQNYMNLHKQYQNMASYPSEQSQEQSDLFQAQIDINPDSKVDPSDELQRELRNGGQLN